MDSPDHHEHLGSTFKTSIDIAIDYPEREHKHRYGNKEVEPFEIPTPTSEYDELKLPSTISIITLTETLLAHAPFITRTNRQFWRRWLLKKQFQQFLISAFYSIAECIAKDGGLNAAGLYDLGNSDFLKTMANNFTQLFYIEMPGGVADRDAFFSKLPEILVFGVINALTLANPKHSKIYNSIKFRELILDWSSELIGGIRPSFCKSKCEWLFQNATESPVIITQERPIVYPRGSEIPKYMQAACRGPYVLEHSPLLFMRLQKNSNIKPLNNTLGSTLPPINSNESSNTMFNTGVSTDGYGESYTNLQNSRNIIDNDPNADSSNLQVSRNNKTETSKIRLNQESYSQFNPLALKCTLTHPPNRPLVNIIHPSAEPSVGKIRCKKADFPLINRTLKESKVARKNILQSRDNEEKKMRSDLKDMYENTQLQLKSLKSVYMKNSRKLRVESK